MRAVRRIGDESHAPFLAKLCERRVVGDVSEVVDIVEERSASARVGRGERRDVVKADGLNAEQRASAVKALVQPADRPHIALVPRDRERGMHCACRACGEEQRVLCAVRPRGEPLRVGNHALGRQHVVQPFNLGQVPPCARQHARSLARVSGHTEARDRLCGGIVYRVVKRCVVSLHKKAVLRLLSFYLPIGFIVGNRSTSLMLAWSVMSMTRRSTPMPRPPVGGRPYINALM